MTDAVTTSALAKRFHAISRGRHPNQSALLRRWSADVSRDDDVLDLVATLPANKQHPELLFAAARYIGVRDDKYTTLRHALIGDWDCVEATMRTRTVVPNQLCTAAAVSCVLAELTRPVSLLEIHCGAGFIANVPHYSCTHHLAGQSHSVHPLTGTSEVHLTLNHQGAAQGMGKRPDVVWARGHDQHPVDVFDPDDVDWLNALIWPDQPELATQITAALQVARYASTPIVTDPLAVALPKLFTEAPPDTQIVVCGHLSHLSQAQHAQLHTLVSAKRGILIGFTPDLDYPDHWAMTVNGQLTARLDVAAKTLSWRTKPA